MRTVSLGDAVIKPRMRLSLNQTDFANRLGVTAMSVSRWESGANLPPGESIVQLAKMADDRQGYWYFLAHIGLTKKDFKGRL